MKGSDDVTRESQWWCRCRRWLCGGGGGGQFRAVMTSPGRASGGAGAAGGSVGEGGQFKAAGNPDRNSLTGHDAITDVCLFIGV